MNFILKISPSFIKKIDSYLRINHSWVWATKIHIHIYLTALLTILFSLIGLVYAIDLTDVPSVGDQNTFFGLLFIPAIVFCIFMLFNMSLFNPDKSDGYRFKYQEFLLFLIYLFTFCLPLLIPFSGTLILNARVADLVEDEQFEIDKKQFNEGLPFFPSANDYSYNYYPSDSVYIYFLKLKNNPNRYVEEENRIEYQREWNILRDSVFYHKGIFSNTRPKLYYSNSLRWENIFYSNYFYTNYEGYDYEYGINDSLFDIYLMNFNLVRNPKVAAQHIAETKLLLKKYYAQNINISDAKILNDYLNNNYLEENDYIRDAVNTAFYTSLRNVTNIHESKFKKIIALDSGFHFGFFVFIFCFTVLFQLFKNIHWKQLLLSTGVGAILLTTLLILGIIFRFQEKSILAITTFLPFVFLLFSIKGFFIKKFSWLLNQINILLAMVLPFYPMIILGYLSEFHDIFHISYFDQFRTNFINSYNELEWVYTSEYYSLVSDIRMYTFLGGLVFYVFVWNSYLKTLFLRYWSLPKNK